MSKSLREKEQFLAEKIEQAKIKLKAIREKRKNEIGLLAMQAGLSDIDNDTLKAAFTKLADELAHVDA